MTTYKFTNGELNTLKKQMETLKNENHDLNIQLMEIDLNLNAVIDMKARQAKKQLKDLRHKISVDIATNDHSIINLENNILKGEYSINTENTSEGK